MDQMLMKKKERKVGYLWISSFTWRSLVNKSFLDRQDIWKKRSTFLLYSTGDLIFPTRLCCRLKPFMKTAKLSSVFMKVKVSSSFFSSVDINRLSNLLFLKDRRMSTEKKKGDTCIIISFLCSSPSFFQDNFIKTAAEMKKEMKINPYQPMPFRIYHHPHLHFFYEQN